MPPRLAQKLIAGRFTGLNDRARLSEWSSPQFVAERLRERVLISADDVATLWDEYVAEGRPVDVSVACPCISPPFSYFWIECQFRNEERWGVVWDAIDLSEATPDDWPALTNVDIAKQSRWMLLGWLFIEQGRVAAGVVASCAAFVGPDGELLGLVFDPPKRNHVDVSGYFAPSFLAISMMHCKNVRVVEKDLVDVVTPRQKSHPTRDKGIKYYTLEIDSMRETLRYEGRSDEAGLKQALHICRGHFKDYRQSGLFGKIKGLFWWDAHARGTREAGVVLKDYEIKGRSDE